VTILREYAPDWPCDRCSHPLKFHAGPTEDGVCMIVEGKVFRGPVRKMPRTKPCFCDGYVPAP
jgi:hypothetical protein